MSHSIARTIRSTPAPLALLILSFLAPTELSLFVADLRLPPHRIVLIALLPLALYRMCTLSSIRIRSFDIAFLLYNIWTAVVYTYHSGEDGVIYGGSIALECLGGYAVARAWVRDIDTFFTTLKYMLGAITVAALIALPDALLGGAFSHDILQSLTGYAHPREEETRLWFTRAYGTFDHPIHYGTFCAAFFACFWYAEPNPSKRYARAAFLFGATLLSMSSAPLLGIAVQSVLIAWDYNTRTAQRIRLPMTLSVFAVSYFVASLYTTRSPFQILAVSATFDPWTAYYRLLIWEYGLNNVWDNPLMGIGLAEWVRPSWMVASTIDAFWLVTAMRCGLLATLMLLLSIFLIGSGVSKYGLESSDKELRRLAMGWTISLITLCLVGTTVHYWNVPHTFFFFFVGLGGWIADPKRTRVRQRSQKQTASGHSRRAIARGYVEAPGSTVYGSAIHNAPIGEPAR